MPPRDGGTRTAAERTGRDEKIRDLEKLIVGVLRRDRSVVYGQRGQSSVGKRGRPESGSLSLSEKEYKRDEWIAVITVTN